MHQSNITVEKRLNTPVWAVKVDGRVFGEIRFLNPQFQYFPAGSREGGGKFDSLNDVIKSLHGN